MLKEYKSWYDLDNQEAKKLEQEFLSHEMGKYANDAMHICVIIGIITFVLSAIILATFLSNMTPYLFVIMILFIISGMIIIVGSTIEYHVKFNAWLKTAKKRINK